MQESVLWLHRGPQGAPCQPRGTRGIAVDARARPPGFQRCLGLQQRRAFLVFDVGIFDSQHDEPRIGVVWNVRAARGRCRCGSTVISESHSTSLPPMCARQCRCRSSTCRPALTPSMKRANSLNCVHWLYTVRTGAAISIDFSNFHGDLRVVGLLRWRQVPYPWKRGRGVRRRGGPMEELQRRVRVTAAVALALGMGVASCAAPTPGALAPRRPGPRERGTRRYGNDRIRAR